MKDCFLSIGFTVCRQELYSVIGPFQILLLKSTRNRDLATPVITEPWPAAGLQATLHSKDKWNPLQLGTPGAGMQ